MPTAEACRSSNLEYSLGLANENGKDNNDNADDSGPEDKSSNKNDIHTTTLPHYHTNTLTH